MAIYLKNSWNVPPLRWGSLADVQYAVRENCEGIYKVDPDTIALAMPMWENHGNIVHDYSPHRNHGIFQGAVTWGRNCLKFGDWSDAVKIEDHVSLDFTNKLTILVQSIPNANSYFLAKCEDAWNQAAYGFVINDPSQVLGAWYSSNGSSGTSVNSVAVDFNEKKIFGLTYDGSNSRFYKGCELLSTAATFTGDIYNSTGRVSLGARYDSSKGIYRYGGTQEMYTIVTFSEVLDINQIALFNAIPYGLYQKVIRPIYFFQQAAPTGNSLWYYNMLRRRR